MGCSGNARGVCTRPVHHMASDAKTDNRIITYEQVTLVAGIILGVAFGLMFLWAGVAM